MKHLLQTGLTKITNAITKQEYTTVLPVDIYLLFHYK